MSATKLVKKEFIGKFENKFRTLPRMGEPEFEALDVEQQQAAMEEVAELRDLQFASMALEELAEKIYVAHADTMTAAVAIQKAYDFMEALVAEDGRIIAAHETEKEKAKNK